MYFSNYYVPGLLLVGALTVSGLPQKGPDGLRACGEAFYYADKVRDYISFRLDSL